VAYRTESRDGAFDPAGRSSVAPLNGLEIVASLLEPIVGVWP
jgi:hypothetical protein